MRNLKKKIDQKIVASLGMQEISLFMKTHEITIRFLAIFKLLPLFQFFVLNSETLHMSSLIDTL